MSDAAAAQAVKGPVQAMRDDIVARLPDGLYEYWQWMFAAALSLPFVLLYQRHSLRSEWLAEIFTPITTGESLVWNEIHGTIAASIDPDNLLDDEVLIAKVKPVGQDIATMADVIEVLCQRARHEGISNDIMADTLRMAGILHSESMLDRMDEWGQAFGAELAQADHRRGHDAS